MQRSTLTLDFFAISVLRAEAALLTHVLERLVEELAELLLSWLLDEWPHLIGHVVEEMATLLFLWGTCHEFVRNIVGGCVRGVGVGVGVGVGLEFGSGSAAKKTNERQSDPSNCCAGRTSLEPQHPSIAGRSAATQCLLVCTVDQLG